MTFSIAIRCPRSGMFGVAAATSSPAVGSRCLFVRAGTGAVLSQHRTDPRLGPRGLDFLAAGLDAAATIEALVASTPDARWRQLAVVDRTGGVAFFHGSEHRPIFAAATGDGMVAIGNILADASVCAAEIEAAERLSGEAIGERLLAALEAGLAAGGEVFPLRSAALTIADRLPFPLADLRVDDDPAPIAALRRLWESWHPQMATYTSRAEDPDAGGRATDSLEILAARRSSPRADPAG